jgi:hypothetical protein
MGGTFSEMFTTYSHALCFCSPAGLRLEIAFKIDKKKNEKKEFYFSSRTKISLTRKKKRTCPRENKKFLRLASPRRSDLPIHNAMASFRDLTELDRARNFSASIMLLGCRSKMRATHTKMKNWQTKWVLPRNGVAIGRILSTAVICLFLSAARAYSVDELLPPFGFRWNDSMAHVEAVLHGAKAKIISRDKKENRDVWTVEGLVHPGLKRTLFTFKQRALVAVELQYEYPDWSIERYNQRMGEIRKYFDEKYGTGKLVSRSRDTDTDVIQTLVGYQWMVGATMLELFYFSAQHGTLLYRTITVDYKAM